MQFVSKNLLFSLLNSNKTAANTIDQITRWERIWSAPMAAWLPKYMVNQAISNGDLIRLLPEYETQGEPLQLVYPSKRHLSPKVRSLIDMWVEMWQKLP